ncbi:MAG: hypothetical protein ACREMK_11230 [Gemmatimonadota bacterium]
MRASAPDPLGPGELGERLVDLPVVVDGHRVEHESVPVPGYYGGQSRPTGVISLTGGGHEGRGENVDWTPEEQARFADICDELVPRVARGATSVGAISHALQESDAHAHHRSAIEAAAIDLALGQAGTSLFRLSDRPVLPVRFCRSIGREEVLWAGPHAAIHRVVAEDPAARIKIDCPPAGWPEAIWKAFAGSGRIVIVDFKREGMLRQVDLAHRYLPDAWLEDPPREALSQGAGWRGRVALDGYVSSAADLVAPPLSPGAINVKAPRVGGFLEALRCLARCASEGWEAYIGGMFEVGIGREQARDLASLFTAKGWNDLAPLDRMEA